MTAEDAGGFTGAVSDRGVSANLPGVDVLETTSLGSGGGVGGGTCV